MDKTVVINQLNKVLRNLDLIMEPSVFEQSAKNKIIKEVYHDVTKLHNSLKIKQLHY